MVNVPIVDQDVDRYYSNILNAISSAAEEAIPKTKPYRGNQKRPKIVPYWNDTIRNLIYKRNTARNKFVKSKQPHHGIQYRLLKAQVQRELRLASKAHWANYCSTLDRFSNLSRVWKTVKAMNGVHTDSGALTHTLKSNGVDVVDNLQKANLISQHFANTSSEANCDKRFLTVKINYLAEINSVLTNNLQTTDDRGINSDFSSYELHKALTNLHEKSSPGVDKISYTLS